jgi:putative exporter of polyketide antibiotics
MNEKLSAVSSSGAMLRGIFFLLLGIALLLHILIPQYLSGLIVFGGAIVMILYGGRLLGLHTMLANLFRKITKE